MDIQGDDMCHTIYADCMFNNCDMPAACKVSGMSGHSSDLNPSPYCNFILIDLSKSNTFHVNGLCFHFANEYILLNLNQLVTRRMIGFFSNKPLYPAMPPVHVRTKSWGMTASDGRSWIWYLIGSHLQRQLWILCTTFFLVWLHIFFTQVLFATHMFPGRGGQHSSKQWFETFINEFQWPSHITRLSKNVRSCSVVYLIFLSKQV